MSETPLTQSRRELEKFFAAGRRRGFQPGEVIVSEGQSADSLHLIVRGRVRLMVTSPSGHVATLAVLVPGEIFGEQALASASASHGVTVTALEPTEMLAIRAADFERLRAQEPSLTDRLLASLTGRVRALSVNVVELLYLPAEPRVLRRVAELSRAFGDGSPGTVIPLTQEDVAALAGVARGTANRALREAERRGILRLGRARMTLLDPNGLAELAGLEQLPALKLTRPEPQAGLPARRPVPPAGLERRVVSLLLAQLSVTGAGSDPERVRELETAFHAALTAAVDAFGGNQQARGGMAAMAVFGAPVARPEDAGHAVRAGLRLTEEMRAIEATGQRASVRVGIETGWALVPMPASGTEPLATGQVVDLAARLVASAPPGAVLVGPETHRATRRLIRYEPLKAIEVEPGAKPLGVWRAVQPIPEAELPEPSITILGRESELGLLQAIWTQVCEERRPHLVTVVGDPGVGKSRLGREFARQVQEHGMYALYGRSLPYGGRTGYGPVAQQLKSLAGISDSDPAADARQRLDRLATELLGVDAGDVSEHMALLLGLGEDTPADRQALFLTVRRLLEAIARNSPALLVFEDLHWADPTQLELLTWLVSRVRDAPLLFLALARPELFERVPAWGAGPSGQTTLRLEPLSQASAHMLVDQLLPADADLASRLAHQADGNPLFIEELAASVSEGVALKSGQLPATVMVTVASRLDALPRPAG